MKNRRKIVGQWIERNGKLVADSECQIIEYMRKDKLEELANRESGWVTLYKHKEDGTHWELSYPQGEMHGGGPPMLEELSYDQVKERYGSV